MQAEFLSDLFESDHFLADELALEFHDDLVFLRPFIQSRPEYASLCAALSALDQKLDAMSGPEKRWKIYSKSIQPVVVAGALFPLDILIEYESVESMLFRGGLSYVNT